MKKRLFITKGQSTLYSGIDAGESKEVGFDVELFNFESEETPLLSLMLRAKHTDVSSPIVDNYAFADVDISTVKTVAKVEGGSGTSFILPLSEMDKPYVSTYSTLRVRGVKGYTDDGSEETPRIDLQLYVVGKDEKGNPIVRCVNGFRRNPADAYCQTPTIPADTTLDILDVALPEKQDIVPPDSVKPIPVKVYLQKRGINNSMLKRSIDEYEHAVRKLKRATNRTLWIGRKGKISVKDKYMGMQKVNFTEGIRWAIKREITNPFQWTCEVFISWLKMFFVGGGKPIEPICLCGSNFLENIQCLDFSKYPGIKIMFVTNRLGWKVARIRTLFGDLEVKYDPTLDEIGYSNSAAILDFGRLVHYVYSKECSDAAEMNENDAKNSSVIIYEALALEGNSHIFIDCEEG